MKIIKAIFKGLAQLIGKFFGYAYESFVMYCELENKDKF